MMLPISDISENISYVTPGEFAEMEKLFGCLLRESTEREAQLLLHIYGWLTEIMAAQATQQSTRDRLIGLAS